MNEIRPNMYIGIHVKYPFFCQILVKIEFARKIFKIYTVIPRLRKVIRSGITFVS